MWHEFDVKVIDSQLESLGVNKAIKGNRIMIRIEDIVRFYETNDIEGDPCVTLLFDDEEITVYESFDVIKKLVKEIE